MLDKPRRIQLLLELFAPEGELLSESPGRGIVRRVSSGYEEAVEIFEALEEPGEPYSGYGYPGRMLRIPELGFIGFRVRSNSGEPTIDVNVSINRLNNVKFKFVGSGQREG